ncbi:uncharacterized protein L969DRAFT_102046 [Mixia osmundae IAM 14324]|uniref:Uncharacterized protein n=1 Tax=Mixia osmundae (strain CBS 9802 / IAM 14324 / JCM 22182 / KY 12970) TaxID=764103 RepID=G7E641_MIXOS|nr:uncharacterized protein L969DRAFT_102046 [Mixia osmundae IAM 14324]KEI40546.1 hypothetical protein L969DRAFT_102046 [Mixia osmundae IAM 14324]GAA98301.1 hypothetical protein E5Q_04985 [Mixia osmundae IAM 14324]
MTESEPPAAPGSSTSPLPQESAALARQTAADAALARSNTIDPASTQTRLRERDEKVKLLRIIDDLVIDKNDRTAALDLRDLLRTLLSNAQTGEHKFLTIKLGNAAIKRRLVDRTGGTDYLWAAGFYRETKDFQIFAKYSEAPSERVQTKLRLAIETLIDRQRTWTSHSEWSTNLKEREARLESERKRNALLAVQEDHASRMEREERKRAARASLATLPQPSEAEPQSSRYESGAARLGGNDGPTAARHDGVCGRAAEQFSSTADVMPQRDQAAVCAVMVSCGRVRMLHRSTELNARRCRPMTHHASGSTRSNALHGLAHLRLAHDNNADLEPFIGRGLIKVGKEGAAVQLSSSSAAEL